MKKNYCIFIYLILIILIFTLPCSAYAHEKLEHQLIDKYDEDITGDGVNEFLYLYGDLLSPESNYYHNIYVIIKSKSNKKWKIHYKGGYEPDLKLFDFTQNEAIDILLQSKIDENGDEYNYNLHNIDQGEIKNIDLPDRIIKGELIDNYQAALKSPTLDKPIILDLHKFKESYTKLGLYNDKGTLSESKQLKINSVKLYEPVLISKNKGYSLKSYQHVNSPDNYNRLGTIETLWYYEDKEWIILQTHWTTNSNTP